MKPLTCVSVGSSSSSFLGGLLGSQAVARDFASRSVKVKAQTQYDMTAYVKSGTREEIGIITDYVDPRYAC